jgi:hypothetical protein
LFGIAAQTARLAASRRLGRPRPGMAVLPWAAPEAFSRRHSPACPARDRGVANRAGVAGLGQDRRDPGHGQPGDGGHQIGQPEVLQDRAHPGLGVGEPGAGIPPVAQRQVRAPGRLAGAP